MDHTVRGWASGKQGGREEMASEVLLRAGVLRSGVQGWGCVLVKIQAKMELRDLGSRRSGGAVLSVVSMVRGPGEVVRGSLG